MSNYQLTRDENGIESQLKDYTFTKGDLKDLETTPDITARTKTTIGSAIFNHGIVNGKFENGIYTSTVHTYGNKSVVSIDFIG